MLHYYAVFPVHWLRYIGAGQAGLPQHINSNVNVLVGTRIAGLLWR